MTREEYDLIYTAFRSYRVYMTDAEEVLSEKILDDLFYPEFDKLKGVDLSKWAGLPEETVKEIEAK